jgi:hypothetical protein
MDTWKLTNPDWWKWKLGKEIIGFYYNSVRGNEGINVMDEDWDNLIILDAARYDTTKKVMSELSRSEELERKVSSGSATGEFVEKNFHGKHMDTVYISANPTITTEFLDTFHDVSCLWKADWNKTEGTVMPEVTTQRAREIEDKYPHKRLIVHYLQPHYPFLDSHIEGSVSELRKEANNNERGKDVNPWRKVRDGVYDSETVWEAYLKNHRDVLPQALELAESLSGKTVITSDHGNVLGRPLIKPLNLIKLYGHPWGVHIDELIEVPWISFDGNRKNIVKGDGAKKSDADDVAEERLRELGYL